MAEILGIAASMVQLIDLGCRLLIISSRLCSDLKNVPRSITSMRHHVQQLINLLRLLEIDFEITNSLRSSPDIVSPQSLHILTGLLNEAIGEATELSALLEKLSTTQQTSLQQVWSAFVSIKKEEEIMNRSHRIESLKSTLQLWYQCQCMKLASQQMSDQLEIQYSNIASSNDAIVTQIKSLNQHISSMQLTSNQTADISPPQRGPQQYVKSCNCFITRQSTYFPFYASQVFFEKRFEHRSGCPYKNSAVSWAVGLRTLRPMLEFAVKIQLGRDLASISCSLSPHNTVDRARSPAFVAIEKARQNLFSLVTADYKHRWLPSYKPEIGTQQRRKYGEIVYSGTISSTQSGYIESLVCLQADQKFKFEVRAIADLLCERLSKIFAAGEASPRDQDVNSDTLLHEFVCFAMCALCLQEDDVSLHLTETIRLLSNGGADLNAIAERKDCFSSRTSGLHPTWVGSPLSLGINYLRSTGFSRLHLDKLRLDRILVEHGCTMSEPIEELKRYHGAIRLFIRNPTLALDLDFPALYIAVINRSEHDLRQLIKLRRINVQHPYNGNFSPLSFAVGWHVGMEILLEAGADPATAIHVAIHQEDLRGIELLLDNGCPIFTPQPMISKFSICHNGDSLMAFALDERSSTRVISLLIDKIAERRRQLQVLASHHLSPAKLQTLEVDRDEASIMLPDKNSYQIFMSQQDKGVHVPTSLWPGTRPSLYHYAGMRYSVARKLRKAGFHDIDIRDQNGTTPLIEALGSQRNTEDKSRLIRWYLKRGADPKLPQIGLKNCLHVFSHSNAYLLAIQIWNATPWSRTSSMGIFQCLSEICGADIPDQCSCWCSSSGCIPAGIVLRHTCGVKDGPRRRRWLFYLPHYSLGGLCLSEPYFSDICRLEIFDRLGMAHTCCGMQTCFSEYGFPEIHYKSKLAEQRHELQGEDAEFKLILDAYLELYQRLLYAHTADFKLFWIAWWITLDRFLPDDSLKNLYEVLHNTLGNTTKPQSKVHQEELEWMNDGYGPDCVGIEATLETVSEALQRDGLEILHHLNPSTDENYFIEMMTHSSDPFSSSSNSLDSSDNSDEE